MEPKSSIDKIQEDFFAYNYNLMKSGKEPLDLETYMRLHRDQVLNPLLKGFFESQGFSSKDAQNILSGDFDKLTAVQTDNILNPPTKDIFTIYEEELKNHDKHVGKILKKMRAKFVSEEYQFEAGEDLTEVEFLNWKPYIHQFVSLSHKLRLSIAKMFWKKLYLDRVEQLFELDIMLSAMLESYFVRIITKNATWEFDFPSVTFFGLFSIAEELKIENAIKDCYETDNVMEFVEKRFKYYELSTYSRTDYTLVKLVQRIKLHPLKRLPTGWTDLFLNDALLLRQLLSETDKIIAEAVSQRKEQ